MGSKSDWIIMKEATLILKNSNVNFMTKIISAHRTPQLMFDFAKSAEKREMKIIIAGAGGSAIFRNGGIYDDSSSFRSTNTYFF